MTTDKESLLICFHTDEGVGWGECAAEIAPSYTAEFVDSAWLVLRDHLLPRLLSSPWSSYEEFDERHGRSAGPSDGQGGDRDRVCSTRTCVSARRAWRRISARRDSVVPVGVVVDLADDHAETAATALARVDEGYRRIKIKIAPGHDVDVIQHRASRDR